MQLRLIITVITFAYATILTQNTLAQSGNVGIGTTNPLARLHVADSGVLFTSTTLNNTSPPPVSGGGIRFMWYPEKAALRAGRVANPPFGFPELSASEFNWDKDSVGIYSISMGFTTKAIGNSSASFNAYTNAYGRSSMAFGQETQAFGNYSTSMGNGTFAVGTGSTSMGIETRATGDYSISMGNNTMSRPYASFVIGRFNDSIASSNPNGWVNTDPVFIVGNGSSNSSRSNAM
ncbi:MAG: hypothetical protein ACK55K_05935, partial [Bacteroidota bacterium]